MSPAGTQRRSADATAPIRTLHDEHYRWAMWRVDQLADAAAGVLAARAAELDAEHAVHGLDALRETELHPLIQQGFTDAGFGVFPEHPYPTTVRARPLPRDRERCDIVLSPGAGQVVLDPVARRADAESATRTLFSDLVDEPAGIEPAEAFWIEIKAVGQFTYESGLPQPNRSYTSELVIGPMRDAAKLARDPAISVGAVLVVLFTADRATADHDLGVLVHRCFDKDLPMGSPSIRRLAIADRIGNTLCTVIMLPVRTWPDQADDDRLRSEPR